MISLHDIRQIRHLLTKTEVAAVLGMCGEEVEASILCCGVCPSGIAFALLENIDHACDLKCLLMRPSTIIPSNLHGFDQLPSLLFPKKRQEPKLQQL